jgi:hypothetical protein
MQDMQCQNCGATLPIENQFVRTATCAFCSATYIVRGSDALDPAGKASSLADYPSRLRVGMTGKIRGRRFHVMGRVRYSYNEGFWEEWQVAWDDGGAPDWLEEDEGLWTLYRREKVRSSIPPYEQIRVGGIVKVNAYDVFVSEKREGRVAGQEGQFSSVLPLTGVFGYFEGGANNQAVSVNYWEEEIEISVGEDLEFSDVVID